jgi:metallo-beta-lactamase family protein
VLPDSGRIQEEDARFANKHHFAKHEPALPLYGEADAQRALKRLHHVSYDTPVEVAPGVTMVFSPAGHLLGSAYIHARLSDGKRILFGGDLGRYGRPVLRDPADAVAADLVLVESTYGGRDHEPDDNGEALADIIRDTVRRSGKLIVPAFAIGRVGEVLYWIRRLESENRIPALAVHVDSPMANEALRFYTARVSELDADMRPAQKGVSAFATARFHLVASPRQSKELTASRKPAIVISSSGMATGGRVLHHLAAALPDPRHTVLFVGFQAAGTRGRLLTDGARDVKIHGRHVPVAARIAKIDSMSAHADRGEIARWLGTLPTTPARLCLVHGEEGPMDALRAFVTDRFGWNPYMPAHGERIDV